MKTRQRFRLMGRFSSAWAAWSRLAALTIVMGLAGCSTTGDPNVDTIFWSKRKADERLAAERKTLETVQDQEAALRRESEELRTAERRSLEQRDRLQLALAILRLEIEKLQEAIDRSKSEHAEELLVLRQALVRLQTQSELLQKSEEQRAAKNETARTALETEIVAATRRVQTLLDPEKP